MQLPTMHDAAHADTVTQQLSMCHSIPRATLSSLTGQAETPFLLLPVNFLASSLGTISALLDSRELHNFISLKLVHELQEQGTPLEI